MSNVYVCETVNSVDNAFAADSRDKDGTRVVSYDARRTLSVNLFAAHVVQVEAVKDAKDGSERGVVTLSSGLRYITARAASAVCKDLAG
jgi:hypothetical protein